jgi:hypothetical protein
MYLVFCFGYFYILLLLLFMLTFIERAWQNSRMKLDVASPLLRLYSMIIIIIYVDIH